MGAKPRERKRSIEERVCDEMAAAGYVGVSWSKLGFGAPNAATVREAQRRRRAIVRNLGGYQSPSP
jgi:hypothetical protein